MPLSWLVVLVTSAVLALSPLAHAESPSTPPEQPAAAPSEPAPAIASATITVTRPAPVAAPRSDTPSAPTVRARRAAGASIALAVNPPISWFRGSFCASLYVGLGRHQAVRGNFATYGDVMPSLAEISEAFRSDRDDPSHLGTVRDYGVGWVAYPQSLWSGSMIELGVLRRDRDTLLRWEDEDVATRSTTYAWRVLVGWSWLYARRLFLSAAVGFSVGHEAGQQIVTPGYFQQPAPTTTTALDRWQIDGEAVFRIGFAFGP